MYEKIITELLSSKAMKATWYESPKRIVRVVRTKYDNKFPQGNIQITLTIGKPNYAERDFIKILKRDGVAFPSQQIYLKYLPKKKASIVRKSK